MPVVLALVAENVGHVKGVGQLTGRDLTPLTGRALFADGISTVLAGVGGGSATTTYGENIGVMAATRVFSTAAYWVAAIAAVLLGLSPKIGAVISIVPAGRARRRDHGALRPDRRHRHPHLGREPRRLRRSRRTS